MRRTVLAAGAVALLAPSATIALAQDQTPAAGQNMPQPYGPNWGAPNSPFYGPTTQASPPPGSSAAAVQTNAAATEQRRPAKTARAHMRRPEGEGAAPGTMAGATTYGEGYGPAAPAYGPNWGAPGEPVYGPATQTGTPVAATQPAPMGPGYYGAGATTYGYGYGPVAPAYGPNWGAPGEPVYGPGTQTGTPVAAAQPAAPAPGAPMVEGRAAFVGDDTFTYAPTPSDQYTNGNGGHWDAFEDESPVGQFSAQQIRSGR
jgi:hypothetical protein